MLSNDVLGWARTAHYVAVTADDGDIQLRSEVGAPTTYFVRRRGPDRVELTQSTDDCEQPLLFVSELAVLESYLVGLFADDIREDLDLPFLELPSTPADLACGYKLSDMVRDYRILSRTNGQPVAAAPDPALSLLSLVPLSHLMGWSIADLKSSFLSHTAAPLIQNGSYSASSPT